MYIKYYKKWEFFKLLMFKIISLKKKKEEERENGVELQRIGEHL